VTVGYWRAVSHNLNAVALECFIDELAQAAGKDPIQYRLDMLDMGSTKHQWSGLSAGVPVGARMKRVLEEVRAKSGWGKRMSPGKGMGVAVMEGYNTVIAMVAEVTVSSDYDVTLDKVTAVVDAGTLIHPDQALAQMQSTINFGQGAGMMSEITIKNGGVEQTNFDMFRVVRMNEGPKVLDIHFIKSDGVPGGLGEPGTAVIPPAIGNAIFAACGKRCRTLPFTPENIKAS
jgi:isoquinoline 1-oxidoreductase subunit beta